MGGNNTYSATTISFHRSLCVDLNLRVSSYLMGPLRKSKRARTKPPSVEETVAGSAPTLPQVEDSSSVTKPSTPVPDTPKDASDKQEDAPTALRSVKAEASSSKPLNTKGSWYGTWPRKSTASTQVARESILADKPTNSSTVDLSRYEPKKSPTVTAARPPSMYLGKSKETLDITMGGTLDSDTLAGKDDNKVDPKTSDGELPTGDDLTKAQAEAPGIQSPPQAEKDTVRPVTSSGWLGSWFGLWSTAAPSTATEEPKQELPVKLPENDQDTVMEDAPPSVPGAPTESEQTVPVAGSSWAFWSTEPTKKASKLPEKPTEPGE